MQNRSRHFASDNYAGICPEVWEAIAEANQGHARSYGEDRWTARAVELMRDVFETPCEVFFVFNGTAANSLALAALCQSYHGILCHEVSHVETDECGAPEFFSNGAKVRLLPGAEGKVDPPAIEQCVQRRSDVHYPKPRLLSLTQATELGTVYSVDELKSIGEICRKLGLRLHMDGTRFANAVVSARAAPRQLTWEAGVDVLCLGASKNGAAVGEAVIFFDRTLAAEFDYRRKQAGQLAAKMRFLSAPWVGLLQDGAWLRRADHANQMADHLASNLARLPRVRILFPRQANAVFVDMPARVAEKLWEGGWLFYRFIASGGYRLMCAWDTQPEDIEEFVRDLSSLLES